MNNKDLYLIAAIAGFTPQIGRLVSMMNYVRHTTIAIVEGLAVNELDYLHEPEGNSIGAILLHIAAAEIGYQVATFENRELNDAEKLEWGNAFVLGETARQTIKGHGVGFYLDKLDMVRTKTLTALAVRDDEWLDEQTAFGGDKQVNNYFKWFHVFTHEVNHRGQIRLIRRQAKQNGIIP